ncbi:MAG: GNAT family N-acetyltransferase [Acidobacteriota bacterium]|nr:GNAT family N-acetyltransferase [Acidobacteriota bacterium]
MLYRLYNSDDFAALYAIEEICFRPPMRFDRGSMRRLVRSHNAATWIAEEDGRMAGFAIVEWARKPTGVSAYIATIEVAPEYRQRGVGGELLSRVEDSARAVDAAALWLHVDVRNAGAIRLYEARGYRCEGREENFYPPGDAALIYRKVLHAAAAD